MNRRLQFFLLTLFLFLWANNAQAEVNLTKLVKKVQPAVVTIITYNMDKKVLCQGTGFFINNKGHLITNYHVLNGAYSAEVKTYDGKVFPIKLVIAENESTDLLKVFVDIPEKTVQWVKITKSLPEVAERILVVGSPMGLEQTISEGIVSCIRAIPNIGKIYQISAPISTGSSGSPVINMKGEVIGVATLYLLGGQNLNFAVPGEYVFKLKKRNIDKRIWKLKRVPGNKWDMEVEKIEKKELNIHAWSTDIFREKIAEAAKLSIYRKYEKAIIILEKLRKGHHTDDIDHLCAAWELSGYSYLNLDKPKKAIEAFKEAIRIWPDHKPKTVGLYFSLGKAYCMLKQYSESVEAYKQAIRINPDSAEAHFYLGVALGLCERYRDAKEAYKQAIRIKPDYAKAHYTLGSYYSLNGNKYLALEEYKILKDLDKELADELFNEIYK